MEQSLRTRPTQPADARWSIPAAPERVSPLVVEVARFLEECGVGGQALFSSQLALEEIVSNVVRHARVGATEVRVRLSLDPGAIHITVEDEGDRFDPLGDAPAADLESDLASRRPGGLGLHLVRHMVDRAEYERDGRTNRFRMRVGRAA